METDISRRIHAAAGLGMVVVTGGGSGALARLLQTPGASRTLLDARIPYSEAALTDFLGGRPDQACHPETARALAMAAYHQSRKLGADAEVFGVGCTASLATDRPKRGAHRIHVGIQTIEASDLVSLELAAGARSREEEETLCSELVLNAVAEAKGVKSGAAPDLLPADSLQVDRCPAPIHWQALLRGQVLATATDDAGTPPAEQRPRTVFPGAFNPVHAGHLGMARVAQEMLGVPTEFEICIRNVDKPPLHYATIRDRIEGLPTGARIWLTATPTFTEKAELFPGATFIVGVDTARRIADPRYYGGHPAARDHALDAIAHLGCSFLVFGREERGQFLTLSDLRLPRAMHALCTAVPEARFRHDLSSTDIRKTAGHD